MWGEGVNEGLSDYKPGINVEDKVALSALVVLVITGLIYSIRMIFMAEGYIDEGFSGMTFDYDARSSGQGPPAEISIIVSGALLEETSKLRFLKAGIFNKKWLLNGRDKGKWAGYPTPNVIYGKFDPEGHSDHLPVFLYLAKEVNL